MTAYKALHVTLTCPSCAGPLEPINQAHTGTCEAVMVYRCADCPRTWLLRLQLATVGRSPPAAARQARYRNGPGGPACDGTTQCRCAHHRTKEAARRRTERSAT